MERRKFTREFKLEAVKLIEERGVTVAQAARDFGVRARCCADGCKRVPPIPSRPSPVRGR
jgi:transposase